MSKYLVISDIHQDDRALEAVLEKAKDYDSIWCLGDVVGHEDHMEHKYNGYKGNVKACYEMLRAHQAHCLIGNWEGWLLDPAKDQDETSHQHRYVSALQAARNDLAENGILDWIRDAWSISSMVFDPFTLVHGSIDNDGETSLQPWETYIYPNYIDLVNRLFLHNKLKTPHMLYGHTHIPGYFTSNGNNMPEWQSIKVADLNREIEYNIFDHVLHFVINPGSLNLPRMERRNEFRHDVPGTAMEIDTHKHVFRYIPISVS